MVDFLRGLFRCIHRTNPEEQLEFASRQLYQLVKYERMNANIPQFTSPTTKFGIYLVPINTPEDENVAYKLFKKDLEMLEGLEHLSDSEFQKEVHSCFLEKFLEPDNKAITDEPNTKMEEALTSTKASKSQTDLDETFLRGDSLASRVSGTPSRTVLGDEASQITLFAEALAEKQEIIDEQEKARKETNSEEQSEKETSTPETSMSKIKKEENERSVSVKPNSESFEVITHIKSIITVPEERTSKKDFVQKAVEKPIEKLTHASLVELQVSEAKVSISSAAENAVLKPGTTNVSQAIIVFEKSSQSQEETYLKPEEVYTCNMVSEESPEYKELPEFETAPQTRFQPQCSASIKTGILVEKEIGFGLSRIKYNPESKSLLEANFKNEHVAAITTASVTSAVNAGKICSSGMRAVMPEGPVLVDEAADLEEIMAFETSISKVAAAQKPNLPEGTMGSKKEVAPEVKISFEATIDNKEAISPQGSIASEGLPEIISISIPKEEKSNEIRFKSSSIVERMLSASLDQIQEFEEFKSVQEELSREYVRSTSLKETFSDKSHTELPLKLEDQLRRDTEFLRKQSLIIETQNSLFQCENLANFDKKGNSFSEEDSLNCYHCHQKLRLQAGGMPPDDDSEEDEKKSSAEVAPDESEAGPSSEQNKQESRSPETKARKSNLLKSQVTTNIPGAGKNAVCVRSLETVVSFKSFPDITERPIFVQNYGTAEVSHTSLQGNVPEKFEDSGYETEAKGNRVRRVDFVTSTTTRNISNEEMHVPNQHMVGTCNLGRRTSEESCDECCESHSSAKESSSTKNGPGNDKETKNT